MSEPTPSSSVRAFCAGCGLVGMLLSGAVVLWGSLAAWRLSRFAYWDDKRSEPIELRAGNSGTWQVTWKQVSGKQPERGIRFDPPIWRADLKGSGADIDLRIEPVDAVVWPEPPPDPHAWIPFTYGEREGLMIDPRRVHHIDYRVVRVDEAVAGRHTRLWVLGSPDSEHTELIPLDMGAALLAAVLGFVPSLVVHWVAKRRE